MMAGKHVSRTRTTAPQSFDPILSSTHTYTTPNTRTAISSPSILNTGVHPSRSLHQIIGQQSHPQSHATIFRPGGTNNIQHHHQPEPFLHFLRLHTSHAQRLPSPLLLLRRRPRRPRSRRCRTYRDFYWCDLPLPSPPLHSTPTKAAELSS